jgi:hypothetical protein
MATAGNKLSALAQGRAEQDAASEDFPLGPCVGGKQKEFLIKSDGR